MKYINDLHEIIALIDSSITNVQRTDYRYCLQMLTTEIDDAFLTSRANCILATVKSEKNFVITLQKLASKCNEQTQDCSSCPVSKYCNSYIASAQRVWNTTAPKIIDLFCGAGGLSLGFAQEGFITALANDIDPCCIDTYSHNHPEIPRKHIVLGDINDIIGNIKNIMRFNEIDVLVGGPPCQGFSIANRQRLIDDPRNHLYKSYIKVLEVIRPRFFVMENVKGMLSVANQVIEDFERVGYTVSVRILNAKDYGIPQNRERLIFIGNRVDCDNEIIFANIASQCKKMPKWMLADALYGLKPLCANRIKNATAIEDNNSGRIISNSTGQRNTYIDLINQGRKIPFVFNHKARYNNDRDIEIFRRLYPGDKSDDPKIADIMPYSRRKEIFKDKYFKLDPNKVCKTITAHMKFDCNMYIHPTQARGLTPREAARIQSYPDDYFFRGAFTKTYMQIGNSVPPLLGRMIARVLKKYL